MQVAAVADWGVSTTSVSAASAIGAPSVAIDTQTDNASAIITGLDRRMPARPNERASLAVVDSQAAV